MWSQSRWQLWSRLMMDCRASDLANSDTGVRCQFCPVAAQDSYQVEEGEKQG